MRQPGVPTSKGTHCPSNHQPGRSWLGARVRHISREELFREIKLFRFHSGGGREVGRDRVSNRKRQITANAPRISLLHIRNLREQDSWESKLFTWCRALKKRMGGNTEEGVMQEKHRYS